VKKKILHASVYFDPNEIVSHLVGLKDVRVLSYARRGPAGEITVEQAKPVLTCPRCRKRAWTKDRPVVSYVDLPFGGADDAALEKAPALLPQPSVWPAFLHPGRPPD
jgi:hypothetical protein